MTPQTFHKRKPQCPGYAVLQGGTKSLSDQLVDRLGMEYGTSCRNCCWYLIHNMQNSTRINGSEISLPIQEIVTDRPTERPGNRRICEFIGKLNIHQFVRPSCLPIRFCAYLNKQNKRQGRCCNDYELNDFLFVLVL